ncbi:MAG TPA: hypothetical protein PKA50_17410 [Gemmatimonadales bacterium]|nr:hypothetical protein [Gemmatimonadales bacterium]
MSAGVLGLLLLPGLLAGQDTTPRIPATFARDARLVAAARVLLQSPAGRAVLARYAASGYAIVFADASGRDANAASDLARAAGRAPDFLTDHRGQQVILYNDTLSPVLLAVGLTHEIVHVAGAAAAGTRRLGEEELLAWNTALDYFLSLPDTLRARAEPKYGPYARWRAGQPLQFAASLRCIYPNTPGCPVPSRPPVPPAGPGLPSHPPP